MKTELKEQLKTLQDFQNYVNRNKIKSMNDILKEDKQLYAHFIASGFSDKIVFYGRKYSKYEINQIYKTLNSLSEFQKFINDYEIRSYTELNKMSSLFPRRLLELEISDKIIYFGKSKTLWNTKKSS